MCFIIRFAAIKNTPTSRIDCTTSWSNDKEMENGIWPKKKDENQKGKPKKKQKNKIEKEKKKNNIQTFVK